MTLPFVLQADANAITSITLVSFVVLSMGYLLLVQDLRTFKRARLLSPVTTDTGHSFVRTRERVSHGFRDASSGIALSMVARDISSAHWPLNDSSKRGKADMITLARELLDQPNWPLHAEAALGANQNHILWPIEAGWWLMKRERLINKLNLRKAQRPNAKCGRDDPDGS